MRASSVALGLALAATAADAQTVISREISTQPVETVVTEGPYGTTITRRPLAPPELADSYAPGTFVRQPLNLAPSYEPSFRPPAPIPGLVLTQPVVAPAAPPVVAVEETPALERVTPRTVVRERARSVERQRSVRTAARPVARGRDVPILAKGEVLPLRRAARTTVALSPAEKRIVYRTIVRERVVSQPARRDIVTTTVAPALPPPVYVERRYDVPTTAYVERRYEKPWWERREQPVYNSATYQNGYSNGYTNGYVNSWRAPVVAADDEIATTPVVARGAAYAIGTLLPANVPLYGVPESLLFRVPTLRPYRYAYLGEQVYLVDPLSNVIVAVVTE
jgi:hypothetical protein